MTLVNKSLGEMLKEIQFEQVVLEDVLAPKWQKDLFEIFSNNSGEKAFSPNLPYIKMLSALVDVPIETIYEVLLNSFERGHGNDYTKLVKLKVFQGTEGNVLRFEDEGKGFDFLQLIGLKKNEKKYYSREGNGLFWLDQPGYHASYEGKGNIVNIQSPIEGEDRSWYVYV